MDRIPGVGGEVAVADYSRSFEHSHVGAIARLAEDDAKRGVRTKEWRPEARIPAGLPASSA